MQRRRLTQHVLWTLLICALLLVSTAWADPSSEADANWLDVPTLMHADPPSQVATAQASAQLESPALQSAEQPHSWALAAIPDALAPPLAQAVVERSELPSNSLDELLFLRMCVLRL